MVGKEGFSESKRTGLSPEQRRVLQWGLRAEVSDELLEPATIVRQVGLADPRHLRVTQEAHQVRDGVSMLVICYASPQVPLHSTVYPFGRLEVTTRTAEDQLSGEKMQHPSRSTNPNFTPTADVVLDPGDGIEERYRLVPAGVAKIFEYREGQFRELTLETDHDTLFEIQGALMDIRAASERG